MSKHIHRQVRVRQHTYRHTRTTHTHTHTHTHTGIAADPYSSDGMPGQIVIEDVEITDNIAFDGFGGGMKIKKGNVTMSRVLFRNNTAKVGGGAVAFQSNSEANMTSCSLIDNKAQTRGGALFAEGQFVDIHVKQTLLERHIAFEGEGGCIYLEGTSAATLSNVDLRACVAGSHGGGASLRGKSSLVLENDVTIRECTATRGMGGGLLAAGDSVVVKGDIDKRVLVEKNRAQLGGAICCMSRISLEGYSTTLLQDNEASKGTHSQTYSLR